MSNFSKVSSAEYQKQLRQKKKKEALEQKNMIMKLIIENDNFKAKLASYKPETMSYNDLQFEILKRDLPAYEEAVKEFTSKK